MEYFKSHEPIIKEEANYKHLDDEAIEFYDDLDSEIDIELETEPMA